MLWSDLEVGDIVSFTDEFRDYYKINHNNYDWFLYKLLTICKINIDEKYIYFEFTEHNCRFIGIFKTGRFCKDENSPVVFRIVKLKDG